MIIVITMSVYFHIVQFALGRLSIGLRFLNTHWDMDPGDRL